MIEREVLFKTNALIKGVHKPLTALEMKMYNTVLFNAQIEKGNEQMVCKIELSKLQELAESRRDITPKALLATLEKFMDIPFRFETEKTYGVARLISSVEVEKESLGFIIHFHKEVYNCLMDYKKLGYSPIDLKLTRTVEGYYTQKLYELLRVWSNNKTEVTYTIDYLKEWLGISDKKSYRIYGNFKNKVILPSLKEMKLKLNMEVEIKENKVGRAFKSITFYVNDNGKRTYKDNSRVGNYTGNNKKRIKKAEKENIKPVIEVNQSSIDGIWGGF